MSPWPRVSPDTRVVNQPHEFRHGWKPLAGALVGAGCGITSIVFYTHGVFAVPVTDSTGWPRGAVQFAFTLMSLLAVVTAPVVGLLVDRFGARRVALWSIVGFFFALSTLAVASRSLMLYYAGFVGIAVLGAGTLPLTWTSVVNQWFDHNRGLALGVALSGTGIAASLAPGYAGWLIARAGWQSAYFWLALTVTAIALPVVWLWFRSPAPSESAVTGFLNGDPAARRPGSLAGVGLREALSGYRLWVLCLSVFLVAGSVAGLITSFVALLTDRGLTLSDAAGFAGLIGISVILGRLGAGLLLDRLWAPAVAAVLLACPAVACLLLDSGTVASQVISACAVLIGLAAGAELDLMAFLTARYFGLRRYASIYGVVFVFFSVAAGIAPAAFGYVFDGSGGYSLALNVAAAACFAGALSVLTLGRYPEFPAAD